jgi:transcription elongation GreA/GreB family factor
MPVRAAPAGGPVALGCVVTVTEGDAELVVLVAPRGGGRKLASGAVLVVTPAAPLGRALLGKHEGDDVDLVADRRTRELSIDRVE